MEWEFDHERIKLARQARDMTQQDLSASIGVTVQQVSAWEVGENKPGQDSLAKICNALSTPPKFFFVQRGNFGNQSGTV